MEITKTPEATSVPLDEFCSRLSKTDRRVELIGAFFASEKRAGRMSDSDQAYRARFAAFLKQPA